VFAHIFILVLVFLYAASIPVSIGMIGKQRKPMTHGVAIGQVLMAILIIAGLAHIYQQL
jgi:hypothetical protein